MFRSIFSFEVNRWYRSAPAYIYFAILFVVTFLFGTLIGGTFDGISVGTGAGSDKVFVNSPISIEGVLSLINNYLGLVIIVAIIGNAILKDFGSNTYQLIFTTPVSKFNYLFGRFSAALFVVLVVLTAPALALMISYAMPWIDADKLGPFMFSPYVYNYLNSVVPNVIICGSIFFAVSLLSRDIFFIWVFLIIFFVVIGISNSYFSTLEKQEIASLIDPFGLQAKRMLFKHWGVYEKNTRQITLSGIFLINRLVWIAVSFVLMLAGYRYFSFSAAPRSLFRRKKSRSIADNEKTEFKKIEIAAPALAFGTRNLLKNLWSLSLNECKTILRNTYFRIIMLFGLVFLLLVSSQIGKLYDTATFPVTSEVIQFLAGTLTLFIVVLTIIFSGDLVWKARDVGMSNILDAMPVPNWVYYVSKTIGLMFMQTVLLSIVIVSGVIVQTFHGYTHYEIGLYFQYLFGFILVDFWMLAILAIFIQTLTKNRYIGFFITAIFYVWNTFFALLVVKHNLLVFASDPGIVYSEMNKFGHLVFPFIIYKVYWGSLTLCLAFLSSLLWSRGSDTSFKSRWRDANTKTSRPAWIAVTASLIIFILTGGYIYYNTNVVNKFQTSFQAAEGQANYEKLYKKYEHSAQPRIAAVKANVDIYPMTRSLSASGIYILKNISTQPIDSVQITYNSANKLEITSFGAPFQLVLNDTENGYRIYKLSKALQPSDSLEMTFNTGMTTKGFTYSFTGLATPVYNGTFVNSQEFMPLIGYIGSNELASNTDRKKHGLGHRPTSNPINDTAAYQRNVFTEDADFIRFEATVSTIQGQTAIAPGYLQKEWTKDGRHYFRYKMDSPILNFYSFLSARYKVKRDKWHDVNIEIYYQEGHEYNIDRMINGIKKALTYYTANFSPYQHKQVRILEFPRYSSFAQSFPNTIPFSEGIGFIADVNGEEDNVDYPFYVTAHEVAHQWFAHQVTGADVEGSNMLSESLAQYGAIKVLEKEHSTDKLRKFLKYEQDKYLLGRSFEREKEKPLAFADMGQGYILYQKGGIVFNALSKYIGEDSLNHAIKRFIEWYAFKAPPYPTTLNLVSSIRSSTPDSLQYMVTDMFEKITLYDNEVTEAKLSKGNGNYTVDFTVDSKKFHVDSTGKSTELDHNDLVEVGLFSKDKLLAKQWYRIKKGTNNLIISSAKEPDKIVIDPNYLLIDKEPKNNEKKIEKKSS